MTPEELRECRRANSRARYSRLKAEGLCIKCGREPAAPGHTMCEACMAWKREDNRARYKPRPKRAVLYMEVTRDEYELPVAVADTPAELARMAGTTKDSVLSSITHYNRDGKCFSRFRKVEIDMEDEYE